MRLLVEGENKMLSPHCPRLDYLSDYTHKSLQVWRSLKNVHNLFNGLSHLTLQIKSVPHNMMRYPIVTLANDGGCTADDAEVVGKGSFHSLLHLNQKPSPSGKTLLWQTKIFGKLFFTFQDTGRARGFEPLTPCSQSRCATRLRYAPYIPIVRVNIRKNKILDHFL